MKFDKSKQEFDLGKALVTGGVNSGFRYRDPFPIYFSRAQGSRVWDIDDNEYIDFLVGNGACILGHGNPIVTEAVREQLKTGLTSGLESELSISVARLLRDMIPSAESVKFLQHRYRGGHARLSNCPWLHSEKYHNQNGGELPRLAG